MKTKAILINSIAKWKEQSTNMVKSLKTEWLQPNNEQAIDRLQKRQRNQFMHRAHNKPG